MSHDIERAVRLAKTLKESREKFKKTQDYMAMGLNVSKNTIGNWEKGIAKPDLLEFLDWFELVGTNPNPYINNFINPMLKVLSNGNADIEALREEVIILDESITEEEIRFRMYVEQGDHGSDRYALRQLCKAYLQLPIEYRAIISDMVLDIFFLCLAKGTLNSAPEIEVDVDALEKAIRCGHNAALEGRYGYVIKDEKKE